MLRALYEAGSGLLNRQKAINTVSNNLANLGTAGYKQDDVVTQSFGESLTYQLGAERSAIGMTVGGVTEAGTFTQFDQGGLEKTGSPLDLAIAGDGFFTVQLPTGGTALTRNGRFSVSGDGYLVDSQNRYVMGENGRIQTGTADITVDVDGGIYAGGGYVDRLRMGNAADPGALEKQEGSLYTGAQANTAFTGSVRQGYIEKANVDMTQEISELMQSTRSFQSCSKVIQMLDQVMDKTVNEVGRL